MFAPDNFIYFVILLTINVIYATHLLFSYNRTILVQLNALAFILLAFRCCSEFYLPQIDDFSTASALAGVHSIAIFVQVAIMDVCTWWYLRPFKGHKHESYFNWGFTIYEIILQAIYVPLLWNRMLYKFAPEKIDGYWQYYADYDEPWMYFYLLTSLVSICIITPILLKSVIEEKKFKLSKWMLFAAYVATTLLVTYKSWTATGVNYKIPNTVVFHMFFALVISLLLTDYRLFRDSSIEAIGDAFNSISDLAIFTKTDMKIGQSNLQAQEVFHISDNIGMNFSKLIASNSRMIGIEVDAFLEKLIQHLGEEAELKLDIQGEEKMFLISASKYKKAGQEFGYTFLLKDITEKRARERLLAIQNEELKNLNNIKDRIFAIIGHDLRKPALAFRGITKKVNYLLQKQDYKTLSALGNNIEEEALALNKLTDNLLNWALMEKDIMPYQPALIRLADIVNENIHLFKNIAKDKSLQLTSYVPEEVQVYADRNAVHTIVRNLIDNAVKYTPKDGQIEIRADRTSGDITIEIRDNGIGIPREKLEDIFLLQDDKSEKGTAGEKGTGLGLHLVYELVKLNKGSLDVRSRVGQGTAFEVVLPSASLRVAS